MSGLLQGAPRRSSLRAPFEGALDNVAGAAQFANLAGDALLPAPQLGALAGMPAGQ
jgi:hypothetical protein